MKLSLALTKLCAIGLFAGSMAVLDLVFSLPAYAGCGTFSANGWSVDAATGETIDTFDSGDVSTCGNTSGSFSSFVQADIRFGWSICHQNCADGFQPNVLYVEVDDTRAVGETIDQGGASSDELCVQQSESQIQYCWKEN